MHRLTLAAVAALSLAAPAIAQNKFDREAGERADALSSNAATIGELYGECVEFNSILKDDGTAAAGDIADAAQSHCEPLLDIVLEKYRQSEQASQVAFGLTADGPDEIEAAVDRLRDNTHLSTRQKAIDEILQRRTKKKR